MIGESPRHFQVTEFKVHNDVQSLQSHVWTRIRFFNGSTPFMNPRRYRPLLETRPEKCCVARDLIPMPPAPSKTLIDQWLRLKGKPLRCERLQPFLEPTTSISSHLYTLNPNNPHAAQPQSPITLASAIFIFMHLWALSIDSISAIQMCSSSSPPMGWRFGRYRRPPPCDEGD